MALASLVVLEAVLEDLELPAKSAVQVKGLSNNYLLQMSTLIKKL